MFAHICTYTIHVVKLKLEMYAHPILKTSTFRLSIELTNCTFFIKALFHLHCAVYLKLPACHLLC